MSGLAHRRVRAIELLTEKVILKPGKTDAYAECQLNIIASFAQLERAMTRERQADGIRAPPFDYADTPAHNTFADLHHHALIGIGREPA